MLLFPRAMLLCAFGIALLVVMVGCGNTQGQFTSVPIQGPSRIAWVMPGAENDRKASIWWCQSDGITTTCERTMLPLSGQREGCALSTNSRVYVVTSPELFTKDISITSCDRRSREVQLEIQRLVLEPKVNKQIFAAMGDTLYFASDEGLIAVDVKIRKTAIVLHRELRRDFGVVRHENDLLISLPAGMLGRWSSDQGLRVTSIDVKNVEPSRVWNNVLVGLYRPDPPKLAPGQWQRGDPPTPAFIPLDDSKRDVVLTLAAKKFGYKGPLDVWIIKDGPVVIGNSEVPPRFCFIPSPGVWAAHWGPPNVGYWSSVAELPITD